MGLGGEGPRGYEAGNDAVEPGVAVGCVVLTPLCTNLTLAVEALPVAVTNGLAADPAVEAINLAATELTAALVLL